MSDLQKVSPGQDLVIPASAYNAFVDAAIAHRSGRNTTPKPPGKQHQYSGNVILIRNEGEEPVERYNALAIDGVIVDPTTNEEEFKFRPVFKGIVPTCETKVYCVLLDSLPAGEIGRAVISGAVIANVNITDTAHRHVATDDETTVLKSSDTGGEIIWSAGSTGAQLAVIRVATQDKGHCTTDHCITRFTVEWDCGAEEPEWGEVELDETYCGSVPEIINQWTLVSKAGTVCTYERYIVGDECPEEGECEEPSEGEWPTAPEEPPTDCKPEIPCPPSSGNWHLRAVDGVLEWIEETTECPE